MRAIAAFTILFAYTAYADDSPDQRRQKAEDAYNAGVDAYQARDYETTVLRWEEAYRLRDVPEVAFNIAKLRFYKLDQPYAARSWMRVFMRAMKYRLTQGVMLPPEVEDLSTAIASEILKDYEAQASKDVKITRRGKR